MRHRRQGLRTLVFGASLAIVAGACSSGIDVDVVLVEPCNQEAVASVDFIRFEPRGTGLDTPGLTTTQRVSDRSTQTIPIPLVSDFRLMATGHREASDSQPFEIPSAMGVSGPVDLTTAKSTVSVVVPFTMVDAFYRTTDLTPSGACTDLAVARHGTTLTYVPATSSVLIIGGEREREGTTEEPRLIERYSMRTGRFEEAGELPVGAQRVGHTATLLTDGRILLAGGEARIDLVRTALSSAFVIDPTAARVGLRAVPPMKDPRTGHQAVRLRDGRVLVAGGRVLMPGGREEDHTYLKSLELFDPSLEVFIYPSNLVGDRAELAEARFGHSLVLLPSGQDVLVAGGVNGSGSVTSFELVHVEGDRAIVTHLPGAALGVGALGHSAVLTPLGVMFAGGYARLRDAYPSAGPPRTPSALVEVWTVSGTTTTTITRACTGSLNQARGWATASMVGARVLWVGGLGAEGRPLGNAEIATLYDQGSAQCTRRVTSHVMAEGRVGHSVVGLDESGEILVVGGRRALSGDGALESVASAEVFAPRRDL